MNGIYLERPKIVKRFPCGIITPPASKSLCHRAVVCAALAADASQDPSTVFNIDRSEDINATISGMSALRSVETRFNAAEKTLRIASAATAMYGRQFKSSVIDCNESGSTLRFLLPIAALSARETVFIGQGRLLQRPLDIYADIFAQSGVEFVRNGSEVRVHGQLRAGEYSMPGDVSSQFVSGLLFALPLADGDSEIYLTTPLESRQYVDLTIDVMRWFGVDIQESESGYHIRGNQRYRATNYIVETDYSQAAFFLAAAALGQTVRVAGLNKESKQGDRAILDVLERMGTTVNWSGDIVFVTAGQLKSITVDARDVPDIIPPIAALCCFCEGTSNIINAGRLRLKESDRLHALATELSKLGANIIEAGDALHITGARYLAGGNVDAWGDHRIAMSMAVAAIRCKEPLKVSGWQCVNKSYPRFWHDFEAGEKENCI